MAADKRPSPKQPRRRPVPDQVEYAPHGLAWLREQFEEETAPDPGPTTPAPPVTSAPPPSKPAPSKPVSSKPVPPKPPPAAPVTAKPVTPPPLGKPKAPPSVEAPTQPFAVVEEATVEKAEQPATPAENTSSPTPKPAAKPAPKPDAPKPDAPKAAAPKAAAPKPAAPKPEPEPEPVAPKPVVRSAPVRPADAPPRPVVLPGAGAPVTPQPKAKQAAAEPALQPSPESPAQGWQNTVFRLSGGRWRPKPGMAELVIRDLTGRIAAPVSGCHRIAVIALKGGVGKTTTTACMGAAFADHRGDRVVAVDANPDGGTLGFRIRRDTQTTKDLLAVAAKLEKYEDLRAYASQTNQRLEVIASEADPDLSEAFGDDDYREVIAVLEKFYSIILTDCGPGLLHDAMRGILPLADQLVVISAASLDGARAASLTLDWLEKHGCEELAGRAVVVINAVRSRASVDVGQLEQHFVRRVRKVLRVPFDRQLEAGAEIVFDQLAPATRQAYLALAATVADGFDGRPKKKVEGDRAGNDEPTPPPAAEPAAEPATEPAAKPAAEPGTAPG